MNKCYLQLWEQSNISDVPFPSGCSIHKSLLNRENYISNYFNGFNSNSTPDFYDNPVSGAVDCFVSDDIFNKIPEDGNLRIMENQKNNLLLFQEIIIRPNELS